MMAGMTDGSDDESRARERARLDYVIELEEAALLALPWDAHPGLRASMERTLDENVTKRGQLDRAEDQA
jgi:hypothetical protein